MAENLDEKVKDMNLEEKAPGKKKEFKGKADKKKKAEKVSEQALEVCILPTSCRQNTISQ